MKSDGAAPLVLGIESSCDETGMALYRAGEGLLGHVLHSQIDLHRAYGGVVPELASRDHVQRLTPLLQALLAQAEVTLDDVDAVAFTQGPGLAPALLVGAAFARTLAWSLDVPAVAVHHMEAHLLSPMLADPSLKPPFLALLVSGGHTQIYAVDGLGDYRLLGESLDDAAGEAFDKTAKMLGLPYPGGPHLAKLAESGQPDAFTFARPMTDRPGFDFSFSGLKTQVLLAWQKSDGSEQTRADVARGFEEAVVDTLCIKCARALDDTGMRTLVVSGGVGANRRLRERLQALAEQRGVALFFPPLEFCTDNGAMIALAGAVRLSFGQVVDEGISVKPRWPMSDLPKPEVAA